MNFIDNSSKVTSSPENCMDFNAVATSIEDIERIKSLNNPNIEGVIIGKAIYDNDIKISDLAKLI